MTTPVDNSALHDDHVRVYYVRMTEEQFDRFESVHEKHNDYDGAMFVYEVPDSRPVRDTRKRRREDSDDESGPNHRKSAVDPARTTTAAVSAESANVQAARDDSPDIEELDYSMVDSQSALQSLRPPFQEPRCRRDACPLVDRPPPGLRPVRGHRSREVDQDPRPSRGGRLYHDRSERDCGQHCGPRDFLFGQLGADSFRNSLAHPRRQRKGRSGGHDVRVHQPSRLAVDQDRDQRRRLGHRQQGHGQEALQKLGHGLGLGSKPSRPSARYEARRGSLQTALR
ncbi:hypothetical protein L1887_63130 [Cichorium endivia]|nr:hypothetical protein L1887_63130 [Cichorium endivia]